MAKLKGNLFGSFQGKIGLTYGRMVHGVNLGANMPVARRRRSLGMPVAFSKQLKLYGTPLAL